MFFGKTNAKAETPILWSPHAKSWLIGKNSDAGRDWGQEETGMTEDEMAGWHHRVNGHEFGWTPGVGDGQGGLACCDSWGCKESDTTERLNWQPLSKFLFLLSPNLSLFNIHATAMICTEKTQVKSYLWALKEFLGSVCVFVCVCVCVCVCAWPFHGLCEWEYWWRQFTWWNADVIPLLCSSWSQLVLLCHVGFTEDPEART